MYPIKKLVVPVVLFLQVYFAFLAITPANAQGTFTLVDSEAVPGPADNLVVVEKGKKKIALVTNFDGNEISTYELRNDSTFKPLDSGSAGGGPRAIAMARDGQYAIVVNSNSDDMSVMAIKKDGTAKEMRRVPSGGDNPFDAAVAFDDLVVITNRDSDEVSLFKIDRKGNMRELGSQSAGIDPHVVSISPWGLVAVANSTSNDLTIFDLDRRGNMSLVDAAFPVGNSPKAVAIERFPSSSGRSIGTEVMFVGTRSAQPGVIEDQIQAYEILRNDNDEVTLIPAGSTSAGFFLTDIEVTKDRLFAVTVNSSGKDEARSFILNGTELTPEASLELPGATPSFKQLTVAKGDGKVKYNLLVTEFQGGWLRSIEFRKR